jgi:hypothetical protein
MGGGNLAGWGAVDGNRSTRTHSFGEFRDAESGVVRRCRQNQISVHWLVQTGKNLGGGNVLRVDGFELFGTLFE